MKGGNDKAKVKDGFLLNIMTLWTRKGKAHYNQFWTNNNTRNGSASQMDELFRECLFNLGMDELIAAFIRDIFILIKSAIFWI